MYLYSSTNLPSIFRSVLLHIFQLRKSFYRSNAIPLVTLRKLFTQQKLVLPVKMTNLRYIFKQKNAQSGKFPFSTICIVGCGDHTVPVSCIYFLLTFCIKTLYPWSFLLIIRIHGILTIIV